MNVEQLISPSIPALTTEDTATRALEIMEENKLDALAVVSADDYVALVTEDGLLGLDDPDTALATSGLLEFKPALASTAHPFEAINVMHETQLPVIPIVDVEHHRYLGCLTRESILNYLAQYSGIGNPGGIIVLEIPPRNYSMFEIARLCENEDVVILNMQSRTNERAMLEITLKLNRTVLDAVVSSFERHNYHVLEVYGKENNDEDTLSKYNQLMNYINM